MSRLAYEQIRDSQGNAVPCEIAEAALSVVEEYLSHDAMSLREAAEFVSEHVGRPLSHEGLRKVMKRRGTYTTHE